MTFTTLMSTDQLAHHGADPHVVTVDCRFRLDDPSWGHHAYLESHIPGAVYLHLDDHLSGPKTGENGRHPLPDPAVFARTLGHLGVTRGMQVVAYDQDNGMYASRLWWLLRWLGHDAVAVLDGGFRKWTDEKRPVVSDTSRRPPVVFDAALRPDMVANAEEVALRIGAPDWRLVDARAPERYRGEVEPIDKVAGHIPTAVNHFFQSNLDDRGIMLAPAKLRTHFKDALDDTKPDHVVCYCGSGVTACQNLLALEHAGFTGAKLYPGSWSEWSSDPSRPTEKSR